MRFYNLNAHDETVSFKQATQRGLGSEGGLYFPEKIPYFDEMKTLLKQDFITRSIHIAKALFGDELPDDAIKRMIKNAFTFPVPLKMLTNSIAAFELFHGPTLAFKDFGACFMAQALLEFNKENSMPTTILTATSGDTGAAVAHAFHQLPHIQVVILYPYERISELQEKLFCTLGGNIHTLAVQGDFDDCQRLVKACFSDQHLVNTLGLNSANSINVSRLLAQCFYYFEAVAQSPCQDNLVIAVPSGNFGNLTAGLLAQQMGLPIKSFIAVTNANDTVPRYLSTGQWQINSTVATLSNAMDVSAPNNWPRVVELYKTLGKKPQENLRSIAINEKKTIEAMQELYKLGYIADPHSSVAYAGLKHCVKADEYGIFLCTAHPAKFKQTVENILQIKLPLPFALEQVAKKTILSTVIPPNLAAVYSYLKNLA